MKTILLASTLIASSLPLWAADAATSTSAVNPVDAQTFTGRVLETMNAATYTYMRVDTGKATNWAAAQQLSVKAGDTVTITDGMPMPNYHSKTLNRDFDIVYFTGRATVAGRTGAGGAGSTNSTELPAGHPPVGAAAVASQLPPGHPPIGAAAAKPAMDFSGIKAPKDGKTVADIVSNRGKLNGKTVVVRGKVVKFNGGIMNNNWLHIRDGSGKEGGNDLAVTTDMDVKVGDTVLVKGKVATDRDFGAGYKYDVIIEHAEVAVE
jgi:hypothetical protein